MMRTMFGLFWLNAVGVQVKSAAAASSVKQRRRVFVISPIRVGPRRSVALFRVGLCFSMALFRGLISVSIRVIPWRYSVLVCVIPWLDSVALFRGLARGSLRAPPPAAAG